MREGGFRGVCWQTTGSGRGAVRVRVAARYESLRRARSARLGGSVGRVVPVRSIAISAVGLRAMGAILGGLEIVETVHCQRVRTLGCFIGPAVKMVRLAAAMLVPIDWQSILDLYFTLMRLTLV